MDRLLEGEGKRMIKTERRRGERSRRWVSAKGRSESAFKE